MEQSDEANILPIRMSTVMRLLIIGAGPYQQYIYDRAKDLGFTIFSVDGNPDAPMFAKSDHFQVIDIYDKEAVVEYARKSKVDVVGTINIDQPMSVVSQIQKELGLPHKETSDVIASTRKDLMRLKWRAIGLNNPQFWIFDKDDIDDVSSVAVDSEIPLIIKPVDNAAKRGISKLNLREPISMVKDKINYAFENSKTNKIILEEYIEGDLFFVPTYIKNDGDAITTLIKQSVNENFVQVKYDAPVEIGLTEQNSIIDQAIKAANCFGVGPYHTEILYSWKDNKPYLVETSPRISYATVALTRLIEKFDPVTQLLSDLSGVPFDPSYPSHVDVKYASLVHLQPQPGKRFTGIPNNIDHKIVGVYEIAAAVPKNHIVQPLKTNVERVMYFVSYSKEKLELAKRVEETERYLTENCFK